MKHLPVFSAVCGALILTACLTPTEGTGRFGEARVQPEFAAGDAPGERGVDVDTIRTIMVRGAETIVHARMAYEPDASQAWILEMENQADSVQVTLELLVGSNVAYRGTRKINVVEGTPGRAPVEDVPVALLESDFAARVDVVPDHVVLTSFGATRQLSAEVYDRDSTLLGKPVVWTSQNNNVVTVDTQGFITATGLGTTNVIASVDGVSGASTVIVDTMLAHRTTIDADSASLAADGKSATQITVRVLDATGTAVGFSAGMVALTSSLGSIGAVADHGNGTYTATLSAGIVAGDAVITGTLNNGLIDDRDTVVLRLQGGDPRRTTIEADSASLAANGKSRTVVTVKVLDAQGEPLGKSAGNVMLFTSLGTLSGINDHADGTYTATLVAANIPGTAVITGTLNGAMLGDTAFVVLRPATSPPVSSTTIDADSAAIDADGIASTRILVTVRNTAGNPLGTSAGIVHLITSLGRLGPIVDHGNGTYTTTLTSDTVAGTAVVGGTLNGVPIADTATVAFRPRQGSPATTTITADSAAINRGGVASTRVLVTVLDAHGNPIGASAGMVLLTTTSGTLTSVVDHGDGTYSATLTSAIDAGIAVITGTLNGVAINDSATVQFRQQRT